MKKEVEEHLSEMKLETVEKAKEVEDREEKIMRREKELLRL